MSIIKKVRSLFSRKNNVSKVEATRLFKKRFASFKELLQSNSDLGTLMAGLEENLRGDKIFSISYIHSSATKAIFHAIRMVMCLNQVSGNKYQSLVDVVTKLQAQIKEELDACTIPTVVELTLPFAEISAANAFCVGGKNARLAEIANAVHLPVPRGFAVTTTAYQLFMQQEGLMEEVRKVMHAADYTQPESISAAAKEAVQRILEAPVPKELEDALHSAWNATFGDSPDISVALRSSAVSEDGGISSFAGQYLSILGLRRDDMSDAFRQVVASFFSPEALTYRLRHGHSFERCAMSMCCLEMVDAAAAGVLFTRHPVHITSGCMVINATWGLGELVVNGSAPTDMWLLHRDTLHIEESQIADKALGMFLNARGGTRIAPVESALRTQPSLTQSQCEELGRMAMALEKHYKQAQDVEWAVDQQGRIQILQTRPMRLTTQGIEKERPAAIAGKTVLLDGGDIVCTGVGCGPAYIMSASSDFSTFPEGGVLVLRHATPNCVTALERAQALVTETGSLTGHTAAVCREFNVPAIFNVADATKLNKGDIITVDALSSRVYADEIPELLQYRAEKAVFLKGTPVHNVLQSVCKYILPLNLTDPKANTFAPAYCLSLHDVMRYVHEQCYKEMFSFSDSASTSWDMTVRFKAKVPFELHLIDLGGGLANHDGPFAYPEQVSSLPFGALLKGMLDANLAVTGPRPVDMSGFMSVLAKSMIESPEAQGQRFGDKSYAIISEYYLNFSSRVGYHYGILDSWCGNTINSNYINFKFAGGAADEVRRIRRVRCIGRILSALDFTVDIVGDSMNARLTKHSVEITQDRLVEVGRLLIVSRQMDMLMVDDNSVIFFADRFLRGEYH